MAALLEQMSKTSRDHDGLFSDKFHQHYAVAKTDKERFKTTYEHMSYLKVMPEYPQGYVFRVPKSVIRSVQLRKEGNELFPLHKEAAVERYNRSIMAAPYPTSDTDPSTELAFSLGNRSLVYFTQGKYEVALKDIELAFKYNYPDGARGKLLRRRVECYKNLGKLAEAASSLQEAEEFVKTGKISTVTKAESLKASPTFEQITGVEVVKTYGQHGDIPAASDCLEVKHCPKFGRHLVATRDIRPGDVLVVERPYASVLSQEHYCTHCYNCLKRSDGMIPCRHCATVMYCSEACRDASWQGYHDIECAVLKHVLQLSDNEIVLLGFRTWLIAYKQCGDLRGLYEYMNDEASSSCPPPHALTCHLQDPAPLVFTASAIALIHCLEAGTNLLSGHPHEMVGVAMVRYMRIAKFNSFRVDEAWHDRSKSLVGPVKGTVGGGLYNLLSLCNHACWPNASRFFCDGDTKVLFAQLPIKKGEQIFILYAGDFKKAKRIERRVTSATGFFFECRCKACVKDWPLYGQLSANDPKVLCTACHVRLQRTYSGRTITLVCPRCKARDSLEAVGLWLEEIFGEMQRVSLDIHTTVRDARSDTTSRAAKLLEELYERVEMPFLPIVDCQELISKSFYKNLGNYTIK